MRKPLEHVLVTIVLIIGSTSHINGQTVDGGWTDWSTIGTPCNVTCGGGTTLRLRTCANPTPQNGGAGCARADGAVAAEEYGEFPCNTHQCASTWSEWTNCTAVCTRGEESRYAICGGLLCTDNQYAEEQRGCNTWNITICPSPCLGMQCPEYALCEDKSTEEDPKADCKCTMGYQMNKDKTACLRPPPTTPTPRPIPTLPPEQKTVAVVISKTASTVLIVFVGLTLALFLAMRIFSPDRVIQMNMEIAIVSAHIFLMFPPDTTEIQTLCRVVSILEHFFFTACFMFMLLESMHMYSLVSYVVKKDGLFNRVQNTLVGWGVSAFIVLVTMSFEYENYGGSYHCWLQMDKSLMTAQFIPIIVMMVITFTLIEAAGAADYPPLKGVDVEQRLSARISQRSNLVIVPLVFTSWVVGMLSEYEQNLPLYGTFSVLNGIVGVAIFFFHCSGNQQVRARLGRIVQAMKRRRKR